MPTNRIGPGTVNVGLNLLAEERAIIGRLAMKLDLSAGAIIRRLMVEGMKQTHPSEAMEMIHIRISHKGGAR